MIEKPDLPDVEVGQALVAAEQEIVDWYDGVVQALVRFSGHDSWHYQSLIAWDPESYRRVYAVVGLDLRSEESLLGILRRNQDNGEESSAWDEFQKKIQEIVKRLETDVLLILCDGLHKIVIQKTRVAIQSVRPYLGLDVESILESGHSTELIEKLT